MSNRKVAAIVIGVSQGGLDALNTLLPMLPKDFVKPIMIVQHRSADSDGYLSEHLNLICQVQVKEAQDKEVIQAGTVYIAPADYHLLVEKDASLSLSCDERVNFTRPSVDVLFESAIDCYGDALLGIILTGNNSDGALGLKAIKDAGGVTAIQDPDDALVPSMPKAARDITRIDHCLTLKGLGKLLATL